MRVRPVEARDAEAWSAMRAALWPDEDAAQMRAEAHAHFTGALLYPGIFVAEDDNGALIGFIEAGIRSHAEGCWGDGPVPFVEGWYVAPQVQSQGVGRALMAAVEDWAHAQGFTQLASDTTLDNTRSQAIHRKLGFAEVERLVAFRKDLPPA